MNRKKLYRHNRPEWKVIEAGRGGGAQMKGENDRFLDEIGLITRKKT